MIDIQNILEADRDLLLMLNGSNSLFLDVWMTFLTSGFTWIPLYVALLYLVIKNNETMTQILLIIGCAMLCVILADGVADFLMKPLVGRWRPSNDPIIKYAVQVVGGMRGSDYGFFSAHAANTFSIAMFFCLLVRSRILSLSLVLWSLTNCYTRIYLGLHYPLDIFCGLLWGAIVGGFVYFIYCKVHSHIAPANNFISTQYTSTGYSLDDIDIVELVLIVTFIFTVIGAVIIY
mgnify:CR=1 FL=1